jgi:hypothetical protein
VWLTAAQEVRIIGLDAALSGRSSVTGKAGAIDTCELPLSSVPTTGYASPEVLAGEMPDRRDDVFSFACVAYELFSAQPPFGRLSALEMKMSRTTLTRPSGMPPRRWREFKRALHWKRAQRTATVHAVLLSLDYSTAKEIIGASSAALATVAQSLVVARDSVALHVPPLSRALKSHLYRLGFELIRLTAATADAVARNLQRATVRLGNLSDTAAIELSRAARRTTRWTTPRTSFDRLRALVAGAIHDLAARCETLAISYWRTMQRRWLPLDRRLRDSATNRWLPVGVTAVALVSLTVLDRTSESSVAQRPSASIAQSATRSATNEAAERSHEINFSPLSFAGDSFLPTGRYAEWPLAAAWQRSVQFVSPLAVHATLFDGPAPQFTFASQSTANRAIKPSSVIAFDNATVAVSDRAYAAVLLLKRTGSTQDPAIVRWRTVVGSAKPGTDYQNIDSGIARFADRQSIRALYVPLTPNRNAQGSRSFTVELSNASGGAALGQIRRTVVTIEGRE